MSFLPIDSIKEQFNQLIKHHHIVVEAETGSGKSTRLPLWASQFGRVLVVEPRRIACTSLAGYIAQQEGSRLGESIGYAIKLDGQYSDDTQVLFVTPGVALRWFSENRLSDFDIVLIDEYHERRWDMDLLVAMLKENASHRLVITSATIEGEKLAKYVKAKRLVASGRLHHVAVSYRAADSHYLPDGRGLDKRVVDVVRTELATCDGDILVFLPGRKEISMCAQMLVAIDGVDVVQLHASVSDRERERALTPSVQQKIVLATNVAETSLTIANISLVIDSGLERRTSQRNGRTVLSLTAISKASANQRAGRAGRVMDGQCIRMYGQHAALAAVTPPELLRGELTEAMLASACCGFHLDQLAFLELLPEKSIQQAKKTLTVMRAIDREGIATEHGEILYPLAIDVLYADLLTRMPTRALQEAMIDLAAGLSVAGYLYKLPTNEEKLKQLADWLPASCDVELIIRLVRGEQCQALDVDHQALFEAQAMARQIRKLFHLPELEVASRFDRKSFFTAVVDTHPELLYVRREKRRQMLANGYVEISPARNSLFNDEAEAAIVFDQHSTPGRGVKQTLNLGTIMFPCSLSYLSELSIGDWVQGETAVEDGVLYSQLALTYAGRIICRKLVVPEGNLVLKPIIEAVVAETFLSGFARQRSEEIIHWRLYVELGLDASCQQHNDLSFEQWFTKQLVDLGISDADELELFQAEDFLFEGIPYWQYEEFASTYPLILNLGDLQLTVEYHAAQKRVYVIYKNGLRRGDPKRWELPRWQGWRIQYKKGSRIVDVR